MVNAGAGARFLVHAQAHKRCKSWRRKRASGGKTLGSMQVELLSSQALGGTIIRLGTHTCYIYIAATAGYGSQLPTKPGEHLISGRGASSYVAT